MYARVLTASLNGLRGEKTWVEVNCENGIPSFSIVGLANLSVKESRERIRAAIQNCGYESIDRKLTVNLMPAGRKKEGTHYDLPIALAVIMSLDLAKTGDYDHSFFDGDVACIGELTLEGKIRPVEGALSMIIGLKKEGITRVVIPKDNLSEAMLVKGMLLYPLESLSQLVDFATGFEYFLPVEAEGYSPADALSGVPDFSDIRGQETAKRAAQVAAAGLHGMLMIGSPGVGKSMIGKRIPGIMPPLTYDEQLDITQIYSVAGLLSKDVPMITHRPFRSPHHSISPTSLIGGGVYPKPGEISLAHSGVLFLDELPEFAAQTLDMLRQPMEDGEISITRLNGKIVFPAGFMLVAAMNPCRCGYFGDPVKQCSCSDTERKRYISRISGPLLDRIDIHIPMERLVYDDISSETGNVIDTKTLREGVIKAVEIQSERYKHLSINYNSQLSPKYIKEFCSLNDSARQLMEAAFVKWNMSARSYHRVLRVARTIADLRVSETIEEEDILEALSYRLPEKYFDR